MTFERTIFIGDVHGCIDELTELLQIVRFGTPGKDRIIFVGDLVDKGLDSLKVLRDVQRILRTFPGSVVVSGNHEEKASRMAKRGIFADPWAEQATESDWAFIDSMPLTWYDAGLDIRVVHGGIFPSLLTNHPDAFEKIEKRGEKWRKGGGKVMNRARRMLRVRYVGGDRRWGEKPGLGDMLALYEDVEGDPFWADVYDGSQGFVIFGHSPWLDGKVRWNEHAAGIDTACVFGKKLTALVVEPDAAVCIRPGSSPTIRGSAYHLVSVDARKRYAKPLEDVN